METLQALKNPTSQQVLLLSFGTRDIFEKAILAASLGWMDITCRLCSSFLHEVAKRKDLCLQLVLQHATMQPAACGKPCK